MSQGWGNPSYGPPLTSLLYTSPAAPLMCESRNKNSDPIPRKELTKMLLRKSEIKSDQFQLNKFCNVGAALAWGSFWISASLQKPVAVGVRGSIESVPGWSADRLIGWPADRHLDNPRFTHLLFSGQSGVPGSLLRCFPRIIWIRADFHLES